MRRRKKAEHIPIHSIGMCSRACSTGEGVSVKTSPNAQFNTAAPDSLAMRVSTMVRRDMFHMFMSELQPTANDLVLDAGVTSDQSLENSNYFEALYPHRQQIVAAGLQDAAFLETLYPGVRYLRANVLELPFADQSFDLVHSSAVLEHVGSLTNQARMISECLRVARRGVCLTTPNRWFPIEFHTQLPLVHWLPKTAARPIFRLLGFAELAQERNLNLMTASELKTITTGLAGFHFRIATASLLGWTSNLILFGRRATQG
ncbi:MAG TPA: methyltransferase domain-containing protein [Xanthobacteraceae bacterium]